jgi:hypothetical protein
MRMMLVLYFCRWAASRCSLSSPFCKRSLNRLAVLAAPTTPR